MRFARAAGACLAVALSAGAETRAPAGVRIELPASPYNYANPELPSFYLLPAIAALDNTPSHNPVTDAGATLGRVLFYDKALSANRSVACATCHRAASGFADTARFSTGFQGGHTPRHSMPLANARYYKNGRFFWDERAASLEAQVLMPIQDSVEMGLTLEELRARVAAAAYYPALFQAAFGDADVTVDRIARALAQFVRSIVSYRSRYDEGRAAAGASTDAFANFTAEENLGKQLFFDNRTGCSACHSGDAFVAPAPTNNGLDALTTDPGVFATSGLPRDEARFKTPSLRNVGLTAPYMHDGRFATLAEVVEHYDSGVQDHPNLDIPREDGAPRRLGLSAAEKQALVAFLHTLTDDAMVADPKFADPFRPDCGGDLDGDGRSDILWRAASGPAAGALFVWLMAGRDVVGASYLDPISTDWVIQATGDFDGDGKADVLWRNMNPAAGDAGYLYLWSMDGARVLKAGYTNAQAGFDWQVQATSDLDGDSRQDILWRAVAGHTGAPFVWLMDGTSVKGAAFHSPVSTDWVIQRVGDMDGDGKADILWRNLNPASPDAGKLYAWLMDGGRVKAQAYTNAQADLAWQVQAIGDLDGDRKADIVWRAVSGPATGALFVWLMDGTSLKGSSYLEPISTDWQIQGLADYTADGRADILWRNMTPGTPDAGRLYLWVMDGPGVSNGTGYTTAQTDFTWAVAPPR